MSNCAEQAKRAAKTYDIAIVFRHPQVSGALTHHLLSLQNPVEKIPRIIRFDFSGNRVSQDLACLRR